MSKSKETLVSCLKHAVLASLADLGIFILSSALLGAIFENRKSLLDVVVYVFLMTFYGVFFYRFHMYRRISTYAEHPTRFDLKAELLGFLRDDGRILLGIYAVAALATEISCFIFPGNTPNPIATATMFALGPFSLLSIPVLRSVICFVYAAAVLCGLALLRSRRIYKDDLMAEAGRRGR